MTLRDNCNARSAIRAGSSSCGKRSVGRIESKRVPGSEILKGRYSWPSDYGSCALRLDVNRREFLKIAASAGVVLSIPSPGDSAVSSKIIGIQVGAVSFVDE